MVLEEIKLPLFEEEIRKVVGLDFMMTKSKAMKEEIHEVPDDLIQVSMKEEKGKS